MNSVGSEQSIFRRMVSLVGHEVDVGVNSTGEKLRGRVSYAMFDSFLLEMSGGKKRVIAFNDLLFVDEV